MTVLAAEGAQKEDQAAGSEGKSMYRVELRLYAAEKTFYTAKAVAGWLSDQTLGPACAWGADGGKIIVREAVLPIRYTATPDLYRTERFGMKGYEFTLPNGTYTVTLHFAETFDNNIREGARIFDVALNGRVVLEKFDPFREAGGFAIPVVMECAGQAVTGGKLRIDFTALKDIPIINALEVRQTSPAKPTVRKTSQVHSRIALATPVAAGKKPLRLLFIGNSLSFFWALTENLEVLLNGGQDEIYVKCEGCFAGGKGLEYHYEKSNALQRIRAGRFDYVVLQSLSPDKLVEYIEKFNLVIRESGAQTLLYCTWEPAMLKGYTEAAEKFKLKLAPVGQAWAAAAKERTGLQLIGADGLHPGLLGAYLTACVFYSVLTGETPEGHIAPCLPLQELQIEPNTAQFLQHVAWQTVEP